MGDTKHRFDIIRSNFKSKQDKQIALEKLEAKRQEYEKKLKSPSHIGESYIKIHPDKPINHIK